MVSTTHWCLVVVGCLALVGCTPLNNEVNSPHWQQTEPPLAITCFLSPQDVTLDVKVSRTVPILGAQTRPAVSENVVDATVRLSQGNRLVTLRYDVKQGLYRIAAHSLPIIAGLTYDLSVSTPTGQQATSHCIIPGSVALGRTTFDSTTRVELGRQATRYFVEAHWQDPADEPNYYQVMGLFRFVSMNGPALTPSPPGEEVTNLQYDTPDDALVTDSRLPSRAMSSGRAYLSNLPTEPWQQTGFNYRYKKAAVSLSLLNISLAYYQYQQAVARQVLASRNPFAEQVPVPTNIRGGVGCFGGYNRTTQVEILK